MQSQASTKKRSENFLQADSPRRVRLLRVPVGGLRKALFPPISLSRASRRSRRAGLECASTGELPLPLVSRQWVESGGGLVCRVSPRTPLRGYEVASLPAGGGCSCRVPTPPAGSLPNLRNRNDFHRSGRAKRTPNFICRLCWARATANLLGVLSRTVRRICDFENRRHGFSSFFYWLNCLHTVPHPPNSLIGSTQGSHVNKDCCSTRMGV